MLNIALEVEEVNALLQVLGDLPSKAMVFPLMMKIEGQARVQQQQAQIDAILADQKAKEEAAKEAQENGATE